MGIWLKMKRAKERESRRILMAEVKRPLFHLPLPLNRASTFSVSRKFCQYRSILSLFLRLAISLSLSLSLSPMIDLRRPPAFPESVGTSVTPLFFRHRLFLFPSSPSLFSPRFLQPCTFLRLLSLTHSSPDHSLSLTPSAIAIPLRSPSGSVSLSPRSFLPPPRAAL